jgi:hypothetical protein
LPSVAGDLFPESGVGPPIRALIRVGLADDHGQSDGERAALLAALEAETEDE